MKELLLRAAREARSHAYCPYSKYPVGAAVLDEQGRIHAGCNVENASFGLTLCAERGAVMAMIAAGGRYVRAVAVVTSDGGTPCGACRQVLAEFIDPALGDTDVWTAGPSGEAETHTLTDLLPYRFNLDSP